MTAAENRPYYEMAAMTSVEFAAALGNVRIALMPVGATEQHGPNMALSTDYVIAHRLCQRLAQRLHPLSIVVPPIPFGFSHHHTGFPGTITLSPETLTELCLDVGRSLRRDGIGHVLLVNGHNGNTALLGTIASRMLYELDLRAAVSFYFGQAADRVKAHGKTERYGHACEVEASVGLYLAPEIVRRDALVPGQMLPTEQKYGFNNQAFALTMPKPFHEQTGNGVFGDARLATEAAGEDIIETALARTEEFVRGFVAA